MSKRRSLRAEVPTLEPGPVLLEQLAALSAGSAPARRRRQRLVPAVVLGSTAVAALSGMTWVAGAMPGVDSPLTYLHHAHAPTPPSREVRPGPSPSVSGSVGSTRPTGPSGLSDSTGSAPAAPGTPGTPQRSAGRQHGRSGGQGAEHRHQAPGATSAHGRGQDRSGEHRHEGASHGGRHAKAEHPSNGRSGKAARSAPASPGRQASASRPGHRSEEGPRQGK